MFGWFRKRAPDPGSEPGAPGALAAAGGPSLQTVRTDPERLLKKLEWTVVRRLDGILQGDYRTLFRGSGFDLADLREYMPHDDVRHIDWNVTARLQVPMCASIRKTARWQRGCCLIFRARSTSDPGRFPSARLHSNSAP
jgi:uncharacterized protein (DUF58 family)